MADTYNKRPPQRRPSPQNGAQRRTTGGQTPNRRPTQKKRKKNNNAYLYMFLGLMAVAIIIVGALIFVTSRNEEPGIDESVSSVESSVSSNLNSSQESSEQSIESGVTEIPDPDETPKNAWKQEDGVSYYYDGNGNPVTGVNEINDGVYVFAEDGKMLSNCWKNVDGKDYYLEADGKAAVGETVIDGKRYFFSSKGINFVVANPWNAVCSATEPIDRSVLVRLPKGYGDQNLDKGLVHKDCYDDLLAMMNDCYRITGKDVYVISGFRTYNYQKNNFENQVAQYTNAGYSRSEAERLAAEWVAVPGTSEHHLGYAVDIIDTQIWDLVEEQETLEGQQWLMENCWKYGFILRYPKNTKDKTGINYEPWHYRYLGKEIAKEVHDSGLTLEEYIASLG